MSQGTLDRLLDGDRSRNLLPCDGEVYDYGCILGLRESERAFEALRDTIEFQQDEVVIRGVPVITSRCVAMHGDDGSTYRYSGSTKVARPWTPELRALKERVEAAVDCSFNVCLLNLYPTGSAGLGWHSDDEPELGPTPTIASLSLGAARRFEFRNKCDGRKVSIGLHDGQLIVMRGVTQHYWQHTLPKCSSVIRPRINLTFRQVRT